MTRALALVLALLPALALAVDLSKTQRAEIEARIKPYSSPVPLATPVVPVRRPSPRSQQPVRVRMSTTRPAWPAIPLAPRVLPCWETLTPGLRAWRKA